MIKSNAFGGVQLTGEDATKFERQVRYAKPSQAAQETLRRGDTLLQRFFATRQRAVKAVATPATSEGRKAH